MIIIFPPSKNFALHNTNTTLSCIWSDGNQIYRCLRPDLAPWLHNETNVGQSKYHELVYKWSLDGDVIDKALAGKFLVNEVLINPSLVCSGLF